MSKQVVWPAIFYIRLAEFTFRMLEFENVSKSFWTGVQRKVILDRVSFKVELGTSLGILAPNGTGKTTLINMMAGLEKPDEGVIRRNCRISFPLGFMGGVVPKHSAMINARYIARLYGLDPDYVEAFCRWLCGLDEYFDQPLGVYSSGMKARFTFSLMLALEFDIYLIDEGMPSSTDAEFNRKSASFLQERLRTTTIIIVSHQPEVLEKFAQKAAVLHWGKLHMFESLEEAKQLYDYETNRYEISHQACSYNAKSPTGHSTGKIDRQPSVLYGQSNPNHACPNRTKPSRATKNRTYSSQSC